MKTCVYNDILFLAAELAGRTRDKIPLSESTILLAVFAAELPDVWNKEAWPELCDNIESVTLDASRCFSKREGANNEMGDILTIFTVNDPRLATNALAMPRERWSELNGRVNIVTDQTTVWVEWQLPATDLLAVAAGDLAATTLPVRFKSYLACKGAEHLLRADGDLQGAGTMNGMAAEALLKMSATIKNVPWWRRGVKESC